MSNDIRKNGKKELLIVTSRYPKIDIPPNGDIKEGKTEEFDNRNSEVITRFLPAKLIKDPEEG